MSPLLDSPTLKDAFSPSTWSGSHSPRLSFVVPLKDEEETLEALVDGISKHVTDCSFEILLIDDGSKDGSWGVIEALTKRYPYIVHGIRFRSNRGKAAALAVGFEAAKGEIIFTMDADLQDDPTEIPRFLAKLDEGFDLVSGWKQVRHDPWHKVLPSRIFNRMLSHISNVTLHDHNCGFKCYRRSVAKSIRLFGELHRMVPSLAGMQGFRIAEIPVTHHARRFGKSKYGIERFIRGFSDMLTIGFLRVYQERPSHFSNTCAVVFGCVALLLILASLLLGITTVQGLIMLSTSLCMFGLAGAMVLMGLLSELLIRTDAKPCATSSVIARVSHPNMDQATSTPIANRYRKRTLAEIN